MSDNNKVVPRPELKALQARLAATLDQGRTKAVSSRHSRGSKTARENLDALIDADSLV